MTTRIRECTVVTAFIVAGVCAAFAQSSVHGHANIADAYTDRSRERREQATSPDHIREIFALANTSAEEEFNINFCGFFTGMSRHDAQDLAEYYKLKDGEYLIEAAPGKAVSKLWFSLKGVRRITRGGSTFDELVNDVANRVGRMDYDLERGYEYRTIDGVVLKMGRNGLNIENAGVGSKKPLVTKANAQRDEKDAKSPLGSLPVPVASIIQNMVTIPGKKYKMGRTEVTQAQWEAVMGKNPSKFKGVDNPVENVSWNDCQKFLKKLNALPAVKELGIVFRLPTEKEWEYACRAGATEDYCKLADGTDITKRTLGEVAWWDDNSNHTTHPVGQKKPNAFGLYDVLGNVAEWCEDFYAASLDRVYRGGCRFDNSMGCMAGSRHCWEPDAHRDSIGFRLACDMDYDRESGEDVQKDEKEAKSPSVSLPAPVASIIQSMVTIPGKNYKMGRTEVTQAQWEAVMGNNPSGLQDPNKPVLCVSWDDCHIFLTRLNALPGVKESGMVFRLPTEEEWEYACRAGATGDYCKLTDGTEITEKTLGEVAWYRDNYNCNREWIHPVGQKKPNAFGLYDMHGNVWEWCEDLYRASGSDRVHRGGGWIDDSRSCSSGNRRNMASGSIGKDLGFRLAASQDTN